jgi:hypothetical protein
MRQLLRSLARFFCRHLQSVAEGNRLLSAVPFNNQEGLPFASTLALTGARVANLRIGIGEYKRAVWGTIPANPARQRKTQSGHFPGARPTHPSTGQRHIEGGGRSAALPASLSSLTDRRPRLVAARSVDATPVLVAVSSRATSAQSSSRTARSTATVSASGMMESPQKGRCDH